MNKAKIIGLTVKRRQAGLSQADLADRAQVTQATISRIERGRAIPSIETVRRIAAVLGCSIDAIMEEI